VYTPSSYDSSFTAKYSVANSKSILNLLQQMLASEINSGESDTESGSGIGPNTDDELHSTIETNGCSVDIPSNFKNGKSNVALDQISLEQGNTTSTRTSLLDIKNLPQNQEEVDLLNDTELKSYIDTLNEQFQEEAKIVMPKFLSGPFDDQTSHDISISDCKNREASQSLDAENTIVTPHTSKSYLSGSTNANEFKPQIKIGNSLPILAIWKSALEDEICVPESKSIGTEDICHEDPQQSREDENVTLPHCLTTTIDTKSDSDLSVYPKKEYESYNIEIPHTLQSKGPGANILTKSGKKDDIFERTNFQIGNEVDKPEKVHSEDRVQNSNDRLQDVPIIRCDSFETDVQPASPEVSALIPSNEERSKTDYENRNTKFETSKLPSITSKDSFARSRSAETSTANLAVKWDSLVSKETSRSSRISIAKPEPTECVDDLTIYNNQFRLFQYLWRRGKSSQKQQKNRHYKNDLRNKVFLRLLKSFDSGEILKITEMLVLVKGLVGEQKAHPFTENEYCDSYVRERWKEYYVVLRKTDDVHEPVVLQLYDIDPSGTEKEPTSSIHLKLNIHVQFYSELDKSISIVVPGRSRTKVYIFKCHNQITAFRWLFTLKQALRVEFSDGFVISAPDLSLTLHVSVPSLIIYKMLWPQKSMKIRQLESGYSVEYCPLIQHLKTFIQGELKERNTTSVSDYIKCINQPWFCYKKYDRLEWVVNNSEVFYIQNMLLKNSYTLEVREMGHTPIEVMSGTKTLQEPTPIEGFLSRITNMSGKQGSFFRSFHKVLYFHTSDNLLFFATYYKATPPSPENEFLESDTNFDDISNKLPEIYEHCPFPLDENDHIPWLNSDRFEHNDRLACGEFDRRVQQIIKAEGLINLSLVKDVTPIPAEDITIAQKLLKCLLWHSNPNLIDDDFIVDSGLEIVMYNGNRVKLIAPNSRIRDEWVTRLTELKTYWSLRMKGDLCTNIDTKMQNIKKLGIAEFDDSNAGQNLEFNEIANSIANPILHNIDSMTLSRCILVDGFLYQKTKKHADFNQYYAVLVPGYMILYRTFKRSKLTGKWKKQAIFKHYITIPISRCYVYSGITTSFELLDRLDILDHKHPEQRPLPRVYADGWMSSEEEHVRCFTLWFGKKRLIKGKGKVATELNNPVKNPGLSKMIARLGITGKSIVFMTRSRQEREMWTHRILCEIDRYCGSGEM
jgi:hypothetical protein